MSDSVTSLELLHRDNDPASPLELRKAVEWEQSQGFYDGGPLQELDSSGEPIKFNYDYRDITDVKVPNHHRRIADMVVMGLTEEEIIAERKLSRATIWWILEYHPVKQHIMGQIARKKLAVEAAKASKLESRRNVADKGFKTLEAILDGVEKPNMALVKAAAETRALHPERVYEPIKEDRVGDAPHDTTTLDDLFARHRRKMVDAQVFNEKVAEIPHESENIDGCEGSEATTD